MQLEDYFTALLNRGMMPERCEAGKLDREGSDRSLSLNFIPRISNAYFTFLAPDDIRLKNTRIGIETILYDYIYRGRAPEEIAKTYRSLTLEQVYATILYYLHNREEITRYLTDWIEWGNRMREEQKRNPPPISEKLHQLRAERRLAGKSYTDSVFAEFSC